MNEHPNLVLVNKFFKAYSSNSIDELQGIFHADVKWHIPGRHPLSGVKNGVGEIVEYLNQLGNFNFRAEGVVLGVSDDYVIDCHKNWSEIENIDNLNNLSCLLWKFEEGKIKEVFNFPQDQHVVDSFFNKNFKDK